MFLDELHLCGVNLSVLGFSKALKLILKVFDSLAQAGDFVCFVLQSLFMVVKVCISAGLQLSNTLERFGMTLCHILETLGGSGFDLLKLTAVGVFQLFKLPLKSQGVLLLHLNQLVLFG